MNKKQFYLVLAISVAAVCGFVNFVVSAALLDKTPALTASSALFEPALQVNSPEKLADSYKEGKFLWTSDSKSLWTPEKRSRAVISKYDPIIRQISKEKGYDWRFISAIAFAESRFDNSAVSGSGAVGLMQIMPVVARQFKVDPLHMSDPHTNIVLGVELLDYIGSTLRFPDSTPEKDRLSIVLASYNCGMGHVLDARRLAAKYGENPNSWSVVSKYLELKNEPEYYGDDVVRCGQFVDNRQTLGFVKKVMRYYDSYCKLAVL